MIQSIQKAMTILSIISKRENKPVTLSEISKQTGFPKPTCSHIIETLCQEGYVKQISRSAGYILGPELFCLTSFDRYEGELVSLCRPVMRWMRKKSHATVVLSVIHGDKKYIIDYDDAEQNIFPNHSSIRIDDIYRTATGRTILSYMGRDTLKKIYFKNGNPISEQWSEITTFESLCDELAKIKNQSIVFTENLDSNGIRTIGYASPIFRRSTCIGAIGLAWKFYPENEQKVMTFEEIDNKLKKVLSTGITEIQRRLDYDA